MPPTARCWRAWITSCAGTIPFVRHIPVAERAPAARGMLAVLWAALRYCYPAAARPVAVGTGGARRADPAAVPADRHHRARAILGPAVRGRDRGAAAGEPLSRLCRACARGGVRRARRPLDGAVEMGALGARPAGVARLPGAEDRVRAHLHPVVRH